MRDVLLLLGYVTWPIPFTIIFGYLIYWDFIRKEKEMVFIRSEKRRADFYAEDLMNNAFSSDEILPNHTWDRWIRERDNAEECEFKVDTGEISPVLDRDSYEYKKGVEEERNRILKVIDQEIEPYKARNYQLEMGVLEDLKDVILGKKEGGEWADG